MSARAVDTCLPVRGWFLRDAEHDPLPPWLQWTGVPPHDSVRSRRRVPEHRFHLTDLSKPKAAVPADIASWGATITNPSWTTSYVMHRVESHLCRFLGSDSASCLIAGVLGLFGSGSSLLSRRTIRQQSVPEQIQRRQIVQEWAMNTVIIVIVVVAVLSMTLAALSIRVVTQYERGVQFRLGKVVAVRDPGLRLIIRVIDQLRKVNMRIVTMPIQSQGIITRDNVSVDISAVAYFKVVDAEKSVIAIENVYTAINQIAQTTLRKVVGKHTLDDALAETDIINSDIRLILDTTTLEWGVDVTLVELKDIQLPDSMKRAMARQAEAEREKRAKIIAAEGESLAAAALGRASDSMMAHPLALQLRNLQTLVELGVDKNTTVVFPAPLMSAIGDLGAFFARETAATETLSSLASSVGLSNSDRHANEAGSSPESTDTTGTFDSVGVESRLLN